VLKRKKKKDHITKKSTQNEYKRSLGAVQKSTTGKNKVRNRGGGKVKKRTDIQVTSEPVWCDSLLI